ncbi:MAG: hypothetical protein ABI353_15020 [Isosphaeraceae bacterium]
MGVEVLKRLGTSRESAARLGRKAGESGAALGIHGVSVTAGAPADPALSAARKVVESYFPVHDTPTHAVSQHKTVELPEPVTEDVADLFNQLFGRR